MVRGWNTGERLVYGWRGGAPNAEPLPIDFVPNVQLLSGPGGQPTVDVLFGPKGPEMVERRVPKEADLTPES